MKIQNPALAGESLMLRYAHDDNGARIMVHGDRQGVFDMPEKDAEHLLATPGWRPHVARGARSLEAPTPALVPKANVKPPLAPPMPQGALRAPTLPAPPSMPAEAVEIIEEPEESEEDGPDIDALKTKKAALEVAEQYGVQLDPESKLSDMKAALEKELYGDESEEKKDEKEDETDHDEQ